MKELITTYMPFLLSAITLFQIFLTGNLNKNSWIIGLINQALWLVWIYNSETYGLLPMNIGLWIVFIRNHYKWNESIDFKK